MGNKASADSQATLEYLQRANLFVVPLDDERRWYRYHRLFGELLRARLQEPSLSILPDEGGMGSSTLMGGTRELHRRAAAWYDQNELPADAVHHALATQDYDLAADVIERAVTRAGTWSRVDVAVFTRWFNALPEDVARTRPWLQLFISRVFYVTGQQEATERALQYVTAYLRDNPSVPDAERILDLVAADRASYAAMRGDVHQAISLARQILARLPAENTAMRVRMASILALAHFRAGDMDEAGRVFSEAIAAATAIGISFAAVPLVCNLAEVRFVQGRLRQAADICEQAMQMGTVDGVPISVTGYADIELGKVLYEQNDLQGAERHVSEGLERLARGGTPDSFGNGYAMLARAKQALGDDRAALAAIQHALQVAQDSDISRVIHLMSACQARIWLAQGQLGQAVRWADEYRQVGATEYLREVEDLTLARVLLAQKASAEALALLDGLLSPAEDAGRLGCVIEIQALRALALRAQGDENAALDALARALALAEPEGYVRVFLDEGEPMETLLLALSGKRSTVSDRTSNVSRDYLGRLLETFGSLRSSTQPPGPKPGTHQPVALVEPLTDRELEVLHFLAERLTNPEIARRLFISLPTVKTHTRNIYGKLGVHSRKQAVAHARALGILSLD
jgi:LuxR family maltose regulon positive regulatory protein